MKRIVVKIGSNVLTRDDGTLDITRMSALVDQIAALRAKGIEVLVVTSGAVACGRSILRPHHQLDSVEQRQLYSAARWACARSPHTSGSSTAPARQGYSQSARNWQKWRKKRAMV